MDSLPECLCSFVLSYNTLLLGHHNNCFGEPDLSQFHGQHSQPEQCNQLQHPEKLVVTENLIVFGTSE
jgi:hypothetical protein